MKGFTGQKLTGTFSGWEVVRKFSPALTGLTLTDSNINVKFISEDEEVGPYYNGELPGSQTDKIKCFLVVFFYLNQHQYRHLLPDHKGCPKNFFSRIFILWHPLFFTRMLIHHFILKITLRPRRSHLKSFLWI